MKNSMKKLFAAVLTLMLMLSASSPVLAEKKISVVTTIFPIYDWVREVVGENANVEITMLLDSGVDLHSYQPTARDIMKVATADVFIYVGGESDEWAEDALEEAVNRTMKVIDLVQVMGRDIKMEEIVEGMEHDHDHDHDDDDDHDDDHDHDEDHDDDDDHDHDHEDEEDEHVWLSLRNAQRFVRTIADTLAQVDPEYAEAYRTNAAAYMEKLDALDARYTEAVSNADVKTLLFGDRFPFRYLADDYGLNYFAAFSGCSAESEASFETVVFLAKKVDELKLPAVLTIEGARHRIAETVVATTSAKDRKILALDSLQSTTAGDVLAGVTYLSVMEKNLDVLKEALTK